MVIQSQQRHLFCSSRTRKSKLVKTGTMLTFLICWVLSILFCITWITSPRQKEGRLFTLDPNPPLWRLFTLDQNPPLCKLPQLESTVPGYHWWHNLHRQSCKQVQRVASRVTSRNVDELPSNLSVHRVLRHLIHLKWNEKWFKGLMFIRHQL